MGILEEILEKVEILEEKIDRLETKEPERKGVFNVEEAAEYLKLSKVTIYRLLNEGELDYIKIGTRKIIPGKVLDEYIDENLTREKNYRNNIREVKWNG